MYLILELLRTKDPWLKLSAADRREKLKQIIPEELTKPGVKLLGVAKPDPEITKVLGSEWNYLAAWLVPSLELVERVRQRTRYLPWLTEYFELKVYGGKNVGETVGDYIAALTEEAPTAEPKKPGLGTRFREMEKQVQSLRDEVTALKSAAEKQKKHESPASPPGHGPGKG